MNRASLLLSCLPGLFLAGLCRAGESPATLYPSRAAALAADDVEGHYRLALWCEENALGAQALQQHRSVLLLDPEHRASRRALGYERIAGRWLKGDDAMKSKGLVEYEGSWVTPEEYALYARDQLAAKADREARAAGNEALKLAWNKDPAVRGRAMGAIEALDGKSRLRPLSIASRISHADVRMRAVQGLGALNRKEALPPLYKSAIFDTDEAIRKAAVESIKSTEAEGRIGPFVGAMNSPYDPVRVHAIEALGWMGDSEAVGPLIARYEIAGGSGQSVYITQVNQISYVQDFDVEVAQTAFIADPVIGVIQDGLSLNFRVLATNGYVEVYEKPALQKALHTLTGKDLGDSASNWAKWYKEQKKAEKQS